MIITEVLAAVFLTGTTGIFAIEITLEVSSADNLNLIFSDSTL